MRPSNRTLQPDGRPADWAELWRHSYSAIGGRAQPSDVQEILKVVDDPGIISFAAGSPDPNLFPIADIADAHQEVFRQVPSATRALQYTHSEGYLPLRAWISEVWTARGVDCRPENVLITSGGQQGLDLAGRLFLDPNDLLLTPETIYPGALRSFGGLGPRFGTLGQMSSAQKGEVKLAYVMPDFANPSGETMDLNERLSLVNAAEKSQTIILEDGAYSHLYYDNAPPPTLLEIVARQNGGIENGNVIYCGTFSKSIAPGMRVGWLVAPANVIRKLVLLKQSADLYTNQLAQMVAHCIATSSLESHCVRLRAEYRKRRDGMMEALSRHMPPGVSWTKPEGGMFLWLTLHAGVDARLLLARALAEEQIAFIPGAGFFTQKPKRNSLRLSFCLNSSSVNEEGVRRLARLLIG